ncbi:MAG: YdcF family protein [Bryobacteraceae bacterium]
MSSKYDGILIPGGGVRPGALLPTWVQRRLDRAVELYAGEFIITLSAGTPHRPPPLDEHGFPILESVAAARYLIDVGIPAERILTETCSLDTVGNAYFSRVIHVEPQRLQHLLVITSDFHMPRTRAAFEWIYGLTPRPLDYILEFEAVSDAGMPPELLRARERKEQQSLDTMMPFTRRITTMQECHNWLFTEHGAYRAAAGGSGSRTLDTRTTETY